MAKQRKQNLKDIEVVEPKVEAPKKPKVKVTYYPLKRRWKVSGEWKEAGEKIGLTEDAYKDYKFKKIV